MLRLRIFRGKYRPKKRLMTFFLRPVFTLLVGCSLAPNKALTNKEHPMSNSSGPDHELLEALAPVSKTSQFAQSYRGIALLYELLKTPQLVNQLYHSRKHICAVFNDRKSLIVVDNVPQWAHPEKLDLPSLLQTLLGDSPSIPHIFTLRYASSILFVQLDQRSYHF